MRRTARFAVIGLALVFAAVPVLADDADDIDCDNDLTQYEMNVCADKAEQKADVELNRAYRDAMHGLDPSRRSLLRAAQRNWLRFRDTECKRQSVDDAGSSDYPMVISDCLAALTRARTKELRQGSRE